MSASVGNPVGVGLRSDHFPHLVEKPRTTVAWCEAISENYMDTAGRPLSVLETVRSDHPVAFHGVSLSIGYMPPASNPSAVRAFREQRARYLARLGALAERIEPFLISDHLCWTGLPGGNVHDLLPTPPLTQESLAWVVEQVNSVQEVLGRRLVLENVSSYLTWESSTFRLIGVRLCIGTAVQLLACERSVHDLYRHRHDEHPPVVITDRPQWLLLFKQDGQVRVREIDQAGYCALRVMSDGGCVEDALTAAVTCDEGFGADGVSRLFAMIARSGLVSAVKR